jgi:hypothetical protein
MADLKRLVAILGRLEVNTDAKQEAMKACQEATKACQEVTGVCLEKTKAEIRSRGDEGPPRSDGDLLGKRRSARKS